VALHPTRRSYPPPSGDGDTERVVGNDLVPDRLLVLAPEIA
jgi:hypothetical protein